MKKVSRKTFQKSSIIYTEFHNSISKIFTIVNKTRNTISIFTFPAIFKKTQEEDVYRDWEKEIIDNCQDLLNKKLLTDIDYCPALSMPNLWTKDIITQIDYPLYKDRKNFLSHVEKNGGDLRLLWEINRLQVLVLLAQGYVITGNKQYLDRCFEIVDAWVKQNPYKQGVNWIDTQEVGIRMTSMLISRSIIQATGIVDQRFDCWDSIIHEHANYVFHNLSIGRKTHNHFLTEVTSLFIFSAMVDNIFKHKYFWLYLSKYLLRKEVYKQINDDGLSAEGSTNYTFFDYDAIFFANYVHIKVFNKNLIDREKLKVMMRVINDFSVGEKDFVKIGDADCGRYIRLDWGAKLSRLGWLPIIQKIFLQEESKDNRQFSPDLFWLSPEWNDSESSRAERFMDYADKAHHYKESGYVSHTHDNKQLFLRLGPSTVNPDVRFTHTHSDFMSFTFFQNGEPIFLDPGTYTYLGFDSKRQLFRSAMQHNTVTLDEKDYLNISASTFGIPQLKTVVASNLKENGNVYSIVTRFNYDLNEYVGREFFFNKELDWLLIASFSNSNKASSMTEHYNVYCIDEVQGDNLYVVSNKLNNNAVISFINIHETKQKVNNMKVLSNSPRYGVIQNSNEIERTNDIHNDRSMQLTFIQLSTKVNYFFEQLDDSNMVIIKVAEDTISINMDKYWTHTL